VVIPTTALRMDVRQAVMLFDLAIDIFKPRNGGLQARTA
jgi:hypothetical protein